MFFVERAVENGKNVFLLWVCSAHQGSFLVSTNIQTTLVILIMV